MNPSAYSPVSVPRPIPKPRIRSNPKRVNNEHKNRPSFSTNLDKIIKFQAIYRGYLVRRNLRKRHIADISSDKVNQSFRYEDNSTFEGQMISNKRNGYGKQTWADGSEYIGYWENDMANGKGKFKYSNGDSYDGDWVDNKATGVGTYIKADGSKYVGEWREDKQHGVGTEVWPDGTSFEGIYASGNKCGRGTYKWANGTEYSGDWVDNRIEGFVLLQRLT